MGSLPKSDAIRLPDPSSASSQLPTAISSGPTDLSTPPTWYGPGSRSHDGGQLLTTPSTDISRTPIRPAPMKALARSRGTRSMNQRNPMAAMNAEGTYTKVDARPDSSLPLDAANRI